MKKKLSLILIYILSATGGIAVAESFESLDAILNTARDVSDARNGRKIEERRENQRREYQQKKRANKKSHRDCEHKHHSSGKYTEHDYRR